jgi:uncharacterized protein YdeI (YjbR/CyaY-like superfamily)
VTSEREQVHVDSRARWRAWLAEHHADSPGVWVVTWKKHVGSTHVPYGELVEEALAYGWIDSQGRGLDADRTQLQFSPRRPGSGWSRPNKERLERLGAAGLMAPPGLAAVERAKADGSWTALDDIENLIEPPELKAALDSDPEARAHWDRFPRTARRAILVWISTAKTAPTRERRVAETVGRAARGERANEPRPPT